MSKVAIVTAASKGMGLACARALAEAGYQLALLSRSAEIHELADQLKGIAVQGSTENEADLSRLVDATLETYGQVDVVINNTGHPPKGALLELSDEECKTGLDLTLMNVIRMSRLITPVMESNGGAIVNISTFGAKEPSLKYSRWRLHWIPSPV